MLTFPTPIFFNVSSDPEELSYGVQASGSVHKTGGFVTEIVFHDSRETATATASA